MSHEQVICALVSVIIPCRNEGEFIKNCLESVLANDYPKHRLEVLVVDGMSNDGTRQILVKYASANASLRVLDNPKRIQASAINIGIMEAKGEIIVRMDAHSRYDQQYISKCVAALDTYGADNVGGRWNLVPRTNSFTGRAYVQALSHMFGVGNAQYRVGNLEEPIWVKTGSFFCMRKEWFQKVGLFNEQVGPSEDMEFTNRFLKAGGRILLIPDIISHYYARSDFRSFFKHNWRNGVWATLPFFYSTVMPVAWRHLVPLAFVVTLLGLGLFSFVIPLARWMLAGAMAAYALASLAASAQIAIKERSIGYLFVMPLVFASLHFSYGLGSAWGLLKGTWEAVSEGLWPGQEANRAC